MQANAEQVPDDRPQAAQTLDPLTRKSRLRMMVAGFQTILSPLLAAVYEVQNALADTEAAPTAADPEAEAAPGEEAEAKAKDEGQTPAAAARQFSLLIDSTVGVVQALVKDAQLPPEMDAARLGFAAGSSQAVAAFYRATGRVLDPEKDLPGLLNAIKTVEKRLAGLIVMPGEDVGLSLPTFRNSLIEALTPVVGAVAQYAYGRPEHGLLAEVGEKIMQKCEQVTRALAPVGATPDEWRQLCAGVLKAAGQLYADCHYAEADRLLYMAPEERDSYFAQHGNKVPMTKVWQGFEQRMALLATLVAYIEIPAPAQVQAKAGGAAS